MFNHTAAAATAVLHPDDAGPLFSWWHNLASLCLPVFAAADRGEEMQSCGYYTVNQSQTASSHVIESGEPEWSVGIVDPNI